MQFRYDDSPYIAIHKVSVTGNWDGEEREMERSSEGWQCSMQIPEGEYHYKFRINDELELNDPYNNLYEPDSNGEYQSVLLINEQGERLYNNSQYSAVLEEYFLTDSMAPAGLRRKKTYFDMEKDKRVMAGFLFTGITGVHVVTAAWYDADGQMFQSTESAVCGEEGTEESDTLWFWMDLEDVERAGKTGMWKLRLFVDGEFLLEDMFTIGSGMIQGHSVLL